MTDVSVVIPTCNRPQLLAVTLHSIRGQEDVDAEVLIVDDGDDPATTALVERIDAPGVRVLPNAGPRGVSGARNTGIRAAVGDWIAFCDDDDLWAPNKLAAQLVAAEQAGAGWVYAGHVLVDEGLRVHGGGPPPPPSDVVATLPEHDAVPGGASSVAVRRDVLEAAGPFDPQLRTSEDWDLWLRLAATGLPAWVPRPHVALRTHAGMVSRNVDQMLADIQVIAERHGVPVDRARHERWAAWTCLQDGRRAAALRHYARAVARGDRASLGRMAVALVHPGVARRRSLAGSDGWTREAQAWVDALREEPAAPSGHPGDGGQPR